MTADSGGKHESLRQQVRTLDNLVDAQAETIRRLEQERDAAGAMLAQTSNNLNATIGALSSEIEGLEEKVRVIDAERDKAATDARVAWSSHDREKKAREGWVQAYRETLTRAEKAEQALGEVITVLHGSNAEGMADCVTAGPQCHYQLPYEACKQLLSVLKSDALRHVHVYAPDTGKCSCGHPESDDSR